MFLFRGSLLHKACIWKKSGIIWPMMNRNCLKSLIKSYWHIFLMPAHKVRNIWGCWIASGKRIMILADVFFPDTKTKVKNCSARPPFKAGRPVPRRKFQPVNVIVWTRHFARAGEGAWLRSSCILKSLWRNNTNNCPFSLYDRGRCVWLHYYVFVI